MVFYSIDTRSRRKVYGCAAVVALMIGSGLAFLGGVINSKAIAPSSLTVYFGLVELYNRLLWRLPVFRWLTGIPNISGSWSGYVTRSQSRSKKEKVPVQLIVNQNWTKIDLLLEAAETVSEAMSVAMHVENTDRIRIIWTYSVRSRKMTEQKNLHGRGVTDVVVRIDKGQRTMEGSFFSSKLRGGHLILTAIRKE